MVKSVGHTAGEMDEGVLQETIGGAPCTHTAYNVDIMETYFHIISYF